MIRFFSIFIVFSLSFSFFRYSYTSKYNIYIYFWPERKRGWTLYAETEFQVSSLQASAITSRATAREKRETGLRATVLQQIKF